LIRLAESADILEIATLGGVCFELEVAFGPLGGTYEIDHACEMLAPCNGPDSVLVLSENAGKIDGVFYAIILRNTMYQRKIAVAQEIVWHTDPALSPYKRMKIMHSMLEMGEWCLTMKGVALSAVGTRLSAPVAGKLLKKLGYTATGIQWHKEL
jgi:hypothetical protein